MDLTQWFDEQLTASADGFVWAVEQVPAERHYVKPPRESEEWSVARHVFHLFYYEQTVVLPTMRQWLGDPLPSNDRTYYQNEDEEWKKNGQDISNLLTKFRAVRAEQLLLLPDFNLETWEEKHDTVWGSVTLKWVVTKTYQHTCEHIHNVLRLALFWDMFAEQQNRGEG